MPTHDTHRKDSRSRPRRSDDDNNEQRRVRPRIDTQNCVICFEPLSRGFRPVGAITPCGHSYHEDCLYGWKAAFLKNRQDRDEPFTCPLCKGTMEGFQILSTSHENEESRIEALIRQELWGPNKYIVEEALHELQGIMEDNERCLQLGVHLGCHVSVLRAMQRFKHSRRVQYRALQNLLIIGMAHADAVCCFVDEAFGAAVEAMQEHQDLDVLDLGMSFLLVLFAATNFNPTIESYFAFKGGMDVAVDAMHLYPRDKRIQRVSSMILRIASQSNAQRLCEKGAVSLILDAMEDRLKDTTAQEHFCWTLYNLSLGEEGKKLIIEGTFATKRWKCSHD